LLSRPGNLLGLALLVGMLLSACTAPVSDSKIQPLLDPSAQPAAETTAALPTPGVTSTPLKPAPTALPVVMATPAATATRAKGSPTPKAHATRPTATSASQACLAKGGRIRKGSLETELLRLPLQFRVYTPACYDLDRAERYPVLYLFHGQSSTDDQWDRMGVDETADRLIAAGEIPPLIIVMPYDRYGGQPTETKFSQAISEVLLPYIDQVYRTIPDRQHRAVGGLSRGAGWAVHFGISDWQLFAALGAHSVAVFHTDAQRMRTLLKQIPADQLPRIYADIGDKDRPEIMRSAVWFVDLLNEFDIAHEWHVFSGYHAEEYWEAHLEQYLRWYTQDW
jgi:enterochelin esterase-like enzyme